MATRWPRAALLAALLALGAAGCGGTALHPAAASSAAAPAATPQLRGLVPEPIPHRPSFTLTDTAGRPFAFGARTRGKLTYLYFGYTHCPDACPATMSDIAYAVRSQPAAVQKQVDVVFVTVDPQRDTRRVLRTWLDHYDRAFIGLTGSATQIAAAERAAGVPVPPPERHTGTHYAVAHSSFVLPYSPDGAAHVVYTQGFVSTDYAHDLPLLLRYR
jgi:protein SCO1/2